MQYDKITTYSIKIQPSKNEYMLKLKLLSVEESFDLSFSSVVELNAVVELLRNENNTYFDKSAKEIIITWEPTGENDPKHAQIIR